LLHPQWRLNDPPILKVLTPRKLQHSESFAVSHTSQRLNDVTATGRQILTARESLTGLAKVRLGIQLIKPNKALLDFSEQIAEDDLLLTRLPHKVNGQTLERLTASHLPGRTLGIRLLKLQRIELNIAAGGGR
jgi:hypothetical protein